jgi:cytosine/adenosine deaminase-related metal-dependent hydrolase
MVDLLISGGTVITMDPSRRVIRDGAVAIERNLIVNVGPTRDLIEKHKTDRVLDATKKIVMPGLIDGHSHSGHGLVKSLGVHSEEWYQACDRIYAEGSTEGFWRAEALLTAVERLRFGVTCSLTFLGGGDSVMRVDDPDYGNRHCEAVTEVGIREFVAVGPRRPPFPRKYSRWDGEKSRSA